MTSFPPSEQNPVVTNDQDTNAHLNVLH
jgi:hypothetical protein